jgi:anti-sigma B factor antagonist
MTLIEMKSGQVLVLDLSGEIDREAAKTFLQRITQILDKGEQCLLVDFTEVTYINSTGLSAIILAAKRLEKSGGKFVLAGVIDPIQNVLRVAGLASLFPVVPTRAEALALFPQ